MIATAAITLPAMNANAWWEMYLTSGARGLTVGSATPWTVGVSPCSGPTVGSPFSVEVMTIALSRYRKPPANAGTARRLRRSSSRSTSSRCSAVLGIEQGSL